MKKPSDLAEIEVKAKVKQFTNLLKVVSGEMTDKEYKQENEILSDGLTALNSLFEENHAVSTPKRFGEFAEKHGITHLNKDSVGNELWFAYKEFTRYAERKQTGYNARHISSIINGLKNKGSSVVIVDLPRNKRIIFGEKSILEKKVEVKAK